MSSRISAPCLARFVTSTSYLISRTRPTATPSCRVSCCRPSRQHALPTRPFSASAPSLVKKYSEDHEWLELGQDGSIATLGITNYASKALGDVVYVELPQPDTEVAAGDTIGAVESVKSASDILTPAAGTITDTNSILEENPAIINKSPEADGWIAKIRLDGGSAALDPLMDAAKYEAFTGEQESNKE